MLNRVRRLLSDPKDIYEAVHPLYVLSNILGLAPYASATHKTTGRRIYVDSWRHRARSFLQMCLIAAAVTVNIYYRKLSYQRDSFVLLKHLQDILSTLVSTVEIFFSCVFASRIVRLFKAIDDLDVSFRKLGVWVPYRIIIQLVTGNIIASVLFVIILGSSLYQISNESRLFKLFSTTTDFLPFLFTVLILIQYRHYLNVIRIRFKLVNEYLTVLFKEICSTSEVKAWTKALSTKRRIETISTSVTTLTDPVYVVDQAAVLHVRLTEAAAEINAIFGPQLLIRILVTFVSLVLALFSIIAGLKRVVATPDDEAFQILGNVLFILWAFFNAFNIVGLVWITDSCVVEASKTPRIMHKIRNYTTNYKLQTTIETYSLQMYHNKLKCTVCGLFPLDFTLLYMIAAGVTTNLIILIQFNTSYFDDPVANRTRNIASFQE